MTCEGREEGKERRKGGKEEVMAGSAPGNRLVSQGLNWNEEDAPKIQLLQPGRVQGFPPDQTGSGTFGSAESSSLGWICLFFFRGVPNVIRSGLTTIREACSCFPVCNTRRMPAD